MKSMAIIYFQNPWQSSYKNLWKIMIIYFTSYYKLIVIIYLISQYS